MMFTHDELIEFAFRWLRKCGYNSIISEQKCYNESGEIVDALGFKWSKSMLVECKTSRGDFLADKKKPFRCCPDLGVGNLRYYLCPEGVIMDDELPEKWGLVYVTGKKKLLPVVHFKGTKEEKENDFNANLKSERAMLLAHVRKMNKQEVKG